MAKAAKTVKTKASVSAYIASIEDDTRRKDAKAVDKLMREITGKKPAMWGEAIVGYGEYDLKSGTWPLIAFAPRKAALVLYLTSVVKKYPALVKKLGKHKVGGGCIYVTNLAEVDQAVLKDLAGKAYAYMRETYGASAA